MPGRQGLEKWTAHFKGRGPVNVVILDETIGISMPGPWAAVKGPSIRTSTGRRLNLKSGTKITVLAITEAQYNQFAATPGAAVSYLPVTLDGRVAVYFVHINHIGKPPKAGDTKGPTLFLKPKNVIGHVTKVKRVVLGKPGTESWVFTDPETLAAAITRSVSDKNFKTNHPGVSKSILAYLKSDDLDTFEWTGDVHVLDKRIIAKDLGELLLGWVLLHNSYPASMFSYQGIKAPIAPDDAVAEFIVPASGSFAVADSVIMTAQGKTVTISSKSGGGAAPSFWTGILDVFAKNAKEFTPKLNAQAVKSSIFYQFLESTRNHAASSQIEKLYFFGVNRYLKMKLSDSDVSAVYHNLLKNKGAVKPVFTPLTQRVLSEYKKKLNKEPVGNRWAAYSDNVSISNWLAAQTIRELKADKVSMTIMHNVIGGVKFYQYSLNLTPFIKDKAKKVKLGFKVFASWTQKLEMVENKAPPSDFMLGNGSINFRLSR